MESARMLERDETEIFTTSTRRSIITSTTMTERTSSSSSTFSSTLSSPTTTTGISTRTGLSSTSSSSSSTTSFLLQMISSTISPSTSSSSSLFPNAFYNESEPIHSEMKAISEESTAQFFNLNNSNSTGFMTINNPLPVTFTGSEMGSSFINGANDFSTINTQHGSSGEDYFTLHTHHHNHHHQYIPGEPSNDLFPDIPIELTQFATFCCVLFMIVGIPGNLLTIIALARCKKVRNATAYFIINLSFCDLLFCCFNLPLALSVFWYRDWVHGKIMCILFPFFRYGLMAVSIFSVLAITLNRYVMIGHPRLYPRLYGNIKLLIQIILIWLGSFGAVIPTLFGVWGRFDLDRDIGSCSIVVDSNNRSPKSFLFLLAFVMPCLAIVICYAKIFMIVRKATIKSHSHQPMEMNRGTTVRGSPLTNANGTNRSSGGDSVDEVGTSPLKSSLKQTNSQRQSKGKRTSLKESSTTKNNQKSGVNISTSSPEHEILKRPSSIGSSNSNSSSSGLAGGEGIRRTGRVGAGSRKKSGLALLGRPSIAVIHQRGKMSSKDRKLLWMILVIFLSFVICYLPITIVKSLTKSNNSIWNIVGYILIYMTTCINPCIYVAMSLEYRQAYKSLLFCTNESTNSRTNQSGSWQPASKRYSSALKSPSTNSDFFSSGSGGNNKRNSRQ